jgi:inositol 1,4,5-triphosphate receptor type 1
MVEELKRMVLKIFKALLEGQQKPSPIYERVLSVLHLEVLQMQLQPPKSEFSKEAEAAMAGTELEAMLEQQQTEAAKPLRPVQVESLVLMEMLAGYNTNLKDEMRISDLVRTKLDSEVSAVEIRWHGALHRRFFHIPEMCKSLSEATRKNLVYTVNRDNQDSKLTDFLERTDDVSARWHWPLPPFLTPNPGLYRSFSSLNTMNI